MLCLLDFGYARYTGTSSSTVSCDIHWLECCLTSEENTNLHWIGNKKHWKMVNQSLQALDAVQRLIQGRIHLTLSRRKRRIDTIDFCSIVLCILRGLIVTCTNELKNEPRLTMTISTSSQCRSTTVSYKQASLNDKKYLDSIVYEP